MGWFIAWLLLGLFLGTGVAGVAFPLLYGFFISTLLVGGMWLGTAFLGLFFPTSKRNAKIVREERQEYAQGVQYESYSIAPSNSLGESVIPALFVIGAVLLLPFAIVFELARKTK